MNTKNTEGIVIKRQFLYLLISFLVASDIFVQEQASQASILPKITSTSSSSETTEVKPLWGGPSLTSFNRSRSSVASIPLHHFDLACENCHAEKNAETDVNRSCTFSGCHEYNPVLNHPINISTNRFANENIPLDSVSRITCLTCHDQEASNSGNSPEDRLLQIPHGMDFCSSCHLQMSGTLKERSHWQFLSQAHLGSINPNRSSQNSDMGTGILDQESQNCLSCHEEISANTSRTMKNVQYLGRLDTMSNHPINMEYSRVASHKAGKYNNLYGQSQQIRLFDGKIGCGSCHSLYSRIKKNLVQDNHGSRLCLECHNI